MSIAGCQPKRKARGSKKKSKHGFNVTLTADAKLLLTTKFDMPNKNLIINYPTDYHSSPIYLIILIYLEVLVEIVLIDTED